MKFWLRLRLIGSVIVLCIAMLALAFALLHRSTTDEDTPAVTPHPVLPSRSVTTGL